MNAKEEFERIKRLYEEDNERIEIGDLGTLINIIVTLEQKLKQDEATIEHYLDLQKCQKVQLSSLYGEHKEIYKKCKKVIIVTSNSYFKDENVDVKITDKFVIIRKEEILVFYNINDIYYFSIKQNESEVK